MLKLQVISRIDIIAIDKNEINSWNRSIPHRISIRAHAKKLFMTGEYDYVEEKDANGVLVRVYTPLGKKEHGNYALQVLSVLFHTCISLLIPSASYFLLHLTIHLLLSIF